MFYPPLLFIKDGSDETACGFCPGYQCTDGTCLPLSARCNNVFQCDSDEECCAHDDFECSLPSLVFNVDPLFDIRQFH
ncbi:hypothetical protein Ciccas_002466 [Cichlidogyrus casuarinus]|uniref:Granulins domain-containing protein n=1 Tax=Cichlidogyrus casuarinus TaxID=1844966 RepID=A0ABD2QHE6_9PLAT